MLIQVKTAGLWRTDIYVAEGKIQSIELLILGHEFAGIVSEFSTKIQEYPLHLHNNFLFLIPALLRKCDNRD
ncbi:MAG: alcohol dehydrogenase catalytic domain-containing protein [Oscillatoriaceae cyanobacterium Prado104]|jgi:D-arabinose 1-dehydrogenase-like Zn-dependent alcohol dehydrogenase|nr:alcohol dehydrogenase catalytic domain-containing protein [Oscillatoriaceae cyanobacterium Prado104]